ncbi:tetratricopeptide repeat protein 17-like [Onthophagus taurus]|uniref:tetratricopeptide repeat protein 17-like n=1 Tax=Onthophagus taurus TaxID=166361 RepID=UPI000C20627F|nr:tetratricopeptide repeat protein 17-like [Onthophagus taurus]
MMGQVHNFQIFTLYILCLEVLSINSRTSSMWKLNYDEDKIVEVNPFQQILSISYDDKALQEFGEDDPIFGIITSTVYIEHSWIKQGVEYYCTRCTQQNQSSKNWTRNIDIKTEQENIDEVLDCGKPVNFTYYDNLVGILNRNKHPNVPEPRLDLILTKSKKTGKGLEFDINALERRLKKAKKEKPKSIHLYNQIGNFWRIKGNSRKAIECFRRALAVSPHNAEVLLNLARVLYTLQYLDDAIYLTRRSLEVQPPDKGAWLQYFTLGEIFKAYGQHQDAIVHLRHTLELKPGFEPAQLALKEMEETPPDPLHTYTLVIIICLILAVLLVVITSMDTTETECPETKPHRHFNKAMAMRSLRGLGISQRSSRSKRLSC